MADNPAKDPAGDEKVGGPGGKKKGMLTGKNKWYLIGGLGVVAVLVFFFVSRSNTNAAGTTATTTGGQMDPATQAALESALQGQAAAGYSYNAATGATGPPGPTGPAGPTGAAGKPGPRGKPAPRPSSHPIVRHPTGSNTRWYTVKPGDTLSGIASRFHYSGGWTSLYHANRSVVGSNPNVIHPGQRLRV